MGGVEPTARELRDGIAARQLSAVDICRGYLARVQALDDRIHAFLTLTADRALARAEAVDRGEIGGPLAGLPIALKDNLCTAGVRTTAGSKLLDTYTPPDNATIVDRLEHAGAIVLGKTNCDEFAMGSSTENSAFGATHNPWALDRIPGGSSGGSAAAVAARLAPLALGSDTGGSVRQPAALCGTVGLKPTYGRVSRYGLIAFASSLDQIGPLSLTVGDAALLLQVIAGADDRDATSARERVPDFTAALTGDIAGVRVGVPRRMIDQGDQGDRGVEPDVAARFEASLEVLRARGARLIDVDLPHARHAIPVYYLVATAEASANLARYDGVRYGARTVMDGHDLRGMYLHTRAEGFGAEVKRRIMLGTFVLSSGYYDAYYLKAQQVRTLIRHDYDTAFETVDVIAMPTSPTAAFRLGERVDDPLQMYLADVFTVSAPLAGLPAISVPCGFTTERLPVGLQLTGRLFDEETLLRVADAYERETEWWRERPPLVSRES